MSLLEFSCQFRYPRRGFKLDFSFTISRPTAALHGPSGVGKTTILHLIAGLEQPQPGRIVLRDRVLHDTQRGISLPIERRRVGCVFQDYRLFPHLTVRQNMEYGARRSAVASRDISQLSDVLELRRLMTRYPESLSGGEKQRVAIGRALAMQPDILLLDEPLSALDNERKSNVLDYLDAVRADLRTPLLLVTHDLKIAESLSAEVIEVPAVNGSSATT